MYCYTGGRLIDLLVGRYESSSCFYFLSKIRNKIIAEDEKRGGVLEVGAERRRYDRVVLKNGSALTREI